MKRNTVVNNINFFHDFTVDYIWLQTVFLVQDRIFLHKFLCKLTQCNKFHFNLVFEVKPEDVQTSKHTLNFRLVRSSL